MKQSVTDVPAVRNDAPAPSWTVFAWRRGALLSECEYYGSFEDADLFAQRLEHEHRNNHGGPIEVAVLPNLRRSAKGGV